MPHRLRVAMFSALAASLAACTNPTVETRTPADQLPALIVPPELVARAGLAPGNTKSASSYDGGDTVARNEDPYANDRASDADDRSDTPTPGGLGVGGGNPGGGSGSGGLGRGPDRGDGFVTASPQPTSYALIVGIERYRDVTAATGARRDAEQFAEVARRTLGIPEDHLRVLLDDRATRTDIVKQVRWLQSNVPAGGRIYVYFSGHGAPDPTSGVSYIVPYDGDPQYLTESAIKMSDILADLEKTKAKDVLAIADSCFSGAGGRSVLAPGTRPLVHVEKVKTTARVALLSASSGAEISGPAPEGNGGLFSKYLMQGLGNGDADMNGDGQISLKELDEWIAPRVKREARKSNRDQNPNLQLGKKLGAADEFIVSWGYAK